MSTFTQLGDVFVHNNIILSVFAVASYHLSYMSILSGASMLQQLVNNQQPILT